MRDLLYTLGVSIWLAGCGGGDIGLASVLADQRQVEWWPVAWRGGHVDVALVHPDPEAGPGPHAVIFALPWGNGSVNEVMDMLFTYWIDEALGL